MRITEERLKQLITEEIIDRLIEKEVERFRKALREECQKQGLLLTEQQEEEEIDLYKKESRRDFLNKLISDFKLFKLIFLEVACIKYFSQQIYIL